MPKLIIFLTTSARNPVITVRHPINEAPQAQFYIKIETNSSIFVLLFENWRKCLRDEDRYFIGLLLLWFVAFGMWQFFLTLIL
jgi:hypothetical protein